MKKTAFCALFCLVFLQKTAYTNSPITDSPESQASSTTLSHAVDKLLYRPVDMVKNMIIRCLGITTGWAAAGISTQAPVPSLRSLFIFEYFAHLPASYFFSDSFKEALSKPIYCFKDYILLNTLFLTLLIGAHRNKFNLVKFFNISGSNTEESIRLMGLAYLIQRKLAGILDIGVRPGLPQKVIISLPARDQRKIYVASLALLFAGELAELGFYLISKPSET